jgi:hypothetical protein
VDHGSDFILYDQLADKIQNNIDRAFFILFYKWGLTEIEIAYCFGISETIVCKRMKNIRKAVEEILCV